LMILLYTFEGGVKTIVYTDTLQTTLMISGLVICVVYILHHFNLSFGQALTQIKGRGYFNVFNFDVNSKGYFLKQILGGAFITIAMTGLDQEMMQKNISVKRLGDSQKNMIVMSIVLTVVLFLFLILGGLLYFFATSQGAAYAGKALLLNGGNVIGDKLFPTVALNMLPPAIGIIFIIALISALFPSADGALTALTSSFCIDMLDIKHRTEWSEKKRTSVRLTVHISMAVVFFLCIILFKILNDKSIIDTILDLAGYTYGPLLGLFSFGILTKRRIANTYFITAIAFASPIICYIISTHAAKWFNGFQIGIELLIINGFITFLGLLVISKRAASTS
jgi:Na+/proline symporter